MPEIHMSRNVRRSASGIRYQIMLLLDRDSARFSKNGQDSEKL